jgi:hypothetical protein
VLRIPAGKSDVCVTLCVCVCVCVCVCASAAGMVQQHFLPATPTAGFLHRKRDAELIRTQRGG